jgi:hypothetical protein
LIEYAAEQLLGPQFGRDWQEDRRRKGQLAKSISDHIRESTDSDLRSVYPNPVEVNWVTRHSQKIEQRWRELSDQDAMPLRSLLSLGSGRMAARGRRSPKKAVTLR